MVDLRTELSLINKHVRQHNREAGESVVWYQFLPFGSGSTYDDVYDEGAVGVTGRSYAPGVIIPTVYVEEIEDKRTISEHARQPTQNIAVTMLYQDVLRAGVESPWEYQARLNDMIEYDGRFYHVFDYESRGRAPSDVVIAVQGFQIYIDQDMMWDNAPVAKYPTGLGFRAFFPDPTVLPYPSPTLYPSTSLYPKTI